VTASGLLINYVIFAYKIENESQYPQLAAQLPKWAQEEQFVLQARPEGDPTKDDPRQMVKAMLAERFKLAMHTKTASLPVYALVLDKPGILGSQLKKRSDYQPCTDTATPPVKHGSGVEPPPYCGLLLLHDQGQVAARMMGYTMPQIAGQLVASSKGELDPIPVVDQTGLSGRYDIQVRYRPPIRSGSSADSLPSEPGESFTDALKSQAGLRLHKQSGAADVYVIDHVEPPAEN
jgi:uncharacterized protein (TIGR03435 family)